MSEYEVSTILSLLNDIKWALHLISIYLGIIVVIQGARFSNWLREKWRESWDT